MQLGSPGGSNHHPVVGREDRTRVVDRHRVFSLSKLRLKDFLNSLLQATPPTNRIERACRRVWAFFVWITRVLMIEA